MAPVLYFPARGPTAVTISSLAKERDGTANVQQTAITRGQKEIFPRHVPIEQSCFPSDGRTLLSLEFNKKGSVMQLASHVRPCLGLEGAPVAKNWRCCQAGVVMSSIV